MKPNPFDGALHAIEHTLDRARAAGREMAIEHVREALKPFNLAKRRIWVQGSWLYVDDRQYWELRNNEDNPMLLALYRTGSFIESLDQFGIYLDDVVIQEPAK